MEKQNRKLESRGLHSLIAGQVEITFYTDPLCCWSWAWQPHFEQLKKMLGVQAIWHLKMGGLIPDWTHFQDETNSVTRPSQMGPIWMHAGQIANKPIYHQIWLLDPPATSYPSCLAVKCAGLQSEHFSFLMFDALQTACMSEGLNIAKKLVLLDVAALFKINNPVFNLTQFIKDFENDTGKDLLSSDLDAVRKYNIVRFPSLIIRANQKTILIAGYRDSETIFDAVKNIFPELTDQSLQ